MAALDSLVLTTELDAVNLMLFTIGEQPVSVLTEAGLSDVAIAKVILAEQNRRVQAKGWDFNTDLDYELAEDINNKVPVPANALRIDTSDGRNLVQRAGFFWDRDDNTFVLNTAVKANIVRFFPFEDLPESARYYIALKACRIFQKRVLGDDSIEVFTEKDESEARTDFTDSEQSSSGRNFLRGSRMLAERAQHTGVSGLGEPRTV